MAAQKKSANRKRRGRGEGAIFQRADGRWVAQVTLGYNAKGRRVNRIKYAGTKGEAQEKLKELQSQDLSANLEAVKKFTVAEYLDHWLSVHEVRPTTRHQYKQVIDNHIKPHIGGVKLAKLSPSQVQVLYSILKKGNSKRAPSLVHAVLSAACNRAIRWGYLRASPCSGLDKPVQPKREVATYGLAECLKFFAAAKEDRFHALFVLAACTGARQGELLGLQWSDVDLQAGTIQIRRGLIEIAGKFSLGEPKTAKSRRLIHIVPIAAEALKAHRKIMAQEHLKALMETESKEPKRDFANTPVFCDQDGGWMRKSNLTRRHFKPAIERAQLPDIRFHDLRHSAATMLLEQGEHPAVVAAILGHGSVMLTLNTYSHVTPALGKDAINRLGEAMERERLARGDEK